MGFVDEPAVGEGVVDEPIVTVEEIVAELPSEDVREEAKAVAAAVVGEKKDVPEKEPRKKVKSGQDGPVIEDLPRKKLNAKERTVIKGLFLLGDHESASLAELGVKCFPEQDKTKANSWVRNSLRRLVRGGWVLRVDRGTYQLTKDGRSKWSEDG